jgi:hypothetical protein
LKLHIFFFPSAHESYMKLRDIMWKKYILQKKHEKGGRVGDKNQNRVTESNGNHNA